MFKGEGTSTDINNIKSSNIYSKLKNMRVWDEKYINGKDASVSQKNIPTTQLKQLKMYQTKVLFKPQAYVTFRPHASVCKNISSFFYNCLCFFFFYRIYFWPMAGATQSTRSTYPIDFQHIIFIFQHLFCERERKQVSERAERERERERESQVGATLSAQSLTQASNP